jgi:uncharacterized membrane protein YkoI
VTDDQEDEDGSRGDRGGRRPRARRSRNRRRGRRRFGRQRERGRGSALDQAGAAALAHTGGGEVTDTEAGDEESYYEVEVTLDDGSQTDVQLDRDFNVVGSEADGQDG